MDNYLVKKFQNCISTSLIYASADSELIRSISKEIQHLSRRNIGEESPSQYTDIKDVKNSQIMLSDFLDICSL